jgi:hypothetical protein
MPKPWHRPRGMTQHKAKPAPFPVVDPTGWPLKTNGDRVSPEIVIFRTLREAGGVKPDQAFDQVIRGALVVAVASYRIYVESKAIHGPPGTKPPRELLPALELLEYLANMCDGDVLGDLIDLWRRSQWEQNENQNEGKDNGQ